MLTVREKASGLLIKGNIETGLRHALESALNKGAGVLWGVCWIFLHYFIDFRAFMVWECLLKGEYRVSLWWKKNVGKVLMETLTEPSNEPHQLHCQSRF